MKRAVFFASILSFAVGFVVGNIPFHGKGAHPRWEKHHEEVFEVRNTGYKFISPLLECEYGKSASEINDLYHLQAKLESFIEEKKRSGVINSASVYFRDLNNGPWIGINEHEAFSPASLLKLPVLIAYYKKADFDPDILDKKIKFTDEGGLLTQNFASKRILEEGKEYTIDDLINQMIVYSDNSALRVLLGNIEAKNVAKVTQDIGAETADINTPEDYMTVKGYAGLYRILYNASYIDRDLSEKALELLSRTDFDEGLVAGVPKDITISHKFGERELGNGTKQLHDCGIVYLRSNPYLLCVMTRGESFENLKNVIKGISSTTFNYINSQISPSTKN